MVMAEFIEKGYFQRHVRRMRRAARARRDALLQGWPAHIDGCAPLPAVDAGLHLCVSVGSERRERDLIARAAAAGVEITALSDFWLPDSQEPVDERGGLVLGFAAVPEAKIAEALLAVKRCWQD